MRIFRWLTRIGPAFVIAAVVLGPGSVTTMSKMGAQRGYAMLWLPLLAGVLMAGFVTLFMRFGITSHKSFLQHCADTWGRPFAALAGLSMFYIATAFQFGNNIGVATALNSLLSRGEAKEAVPAWLWPVVFNALALAFLFAFRRIYKILEKMMTTLVAVMLVAFFINLFVAKPDLGGIASGFVPSLPANATEWLTAVGLVATTFSIVGAIFQTYMVRARGWTEADYGKGVADAVSGIGMLMLISMVIMTTAAAVLHPDKIEIASAGDMAVLLESLLGAGARVVFCIGFFSAAFSSFLVNAMIGGTLLADGLGKSDDINSMPAKVGSALSLVIGMVVAILVLVSGRVSKADALVAGQAGTLLAMPLAVLATLVVLYYPRGSGARPLRLPAKIFAAVGVVVLLAITLNFYKGAYDRWLAPSELPPAAAAAATVVTPTTAGPSEPAPHAP
jgi:NRAMP (natural resistance-associated macrophage protein)-like metal ion transporter